MLLKIKAILQLTRIYLSLAIAFSALLGFFIYTRRLNSHAFLIFSGVYFLSSSASALNQFQERNLDILMNRTKDRPLPAKKIKPENAIIISAILGLSGLSIIFFSTTGLACILALFNIVWYNMIYTPLKRKTGFAVLIGALTGSIPPVIGWAAAGGNLFNPEIIFIAFFMYMWQIPHFLLLLFKFGKEYEKAGFPSLIKNLNEENVRVIIFIWILGTACSSMFLPIFNIISNVALITALIIFNIFIILFYFKIIILKKKSTNFNSAFYSIYIYQIVIFMILIIDKSYQKLLIFF